MGQRQVDRRRRSASCVAVLLVWVLFPASKTKADESQWGNLTMRFLCPDAPAAAEDPAVVIDRKTGAVANVLVYLRSDAPPIHDSYAASARDDVTIWFARKGIEPRLSVVRVSQVLMIASKENGPHAPAFTPPGSPPMSPLLQIADAVPYRFPQAYSVPAPIGCAVHKEELAFVLALDHPYGAVSDALGKLRIEQIPIGEHDFRFWHERCGYATRLRSGDDEWTLVRGLRKIEIKPGENDLGDLVIPAALFERRP